MARERLADLSAGSIVSEAEWDALTNNVNSLNGYEAGQGGLSPFNGIRLLRSYSPTDRNSISLEGSFVYGDDGNLYVRNSTTWTRVGSGGGGAGVTVASGAPASPSTGDLWYSTSTLALNIYNGTDWVAVTATVSGSTIGVNTLPGDRIVDNSIPRAKYGDLTIEGGKIADNTIDAGKLTNSLTPSKFVTDTANSNKVLSTNGVGVPSWSDPVAASIADLSIENDKIANNTLNLVNKTARVTSTDYNKILATNATTGALEYIDKATAGLINTANLVDNAVTLAKMAHGTAGKFIGYSSTGVPIELDGTTASISVSSALSGSGTSASPLDINSAGVTSGKIATGAVGTSQLAALAVTNAKIALKAVDTAELEDGAVTAIKIASGAVGSAAIAEGVVNTRHIQNNTVGSGDMQTRAITSSGLSAIPTLIADPLDIMGRAAREGDLYYNTTQNALRAYNGSSWNDVGSGSVSIAAGSVGATQLADNAVGLAQMAHQTRGSMISFGSGNAPIVLAKGSAGQSLLAGANDVYWGTPAAPSSVQASILTGSFDANILPSSDKTYDVGSGSRTFRNVYATQYRGESNETFTLKTFGEHITIDTHDGTSQHTPTNYGHFVPSNTNAMIDLGRPTHYWGDVYSSRFHFKTAPTMFDDYPDVELVKGIRGDSESGTFIMPDEVYDTIDGQRFIDGNKMFGLQFGTMKEMIGRMEKIEAKLVELEGKK